MGRRLKNPSPVVVVGTIAALGLVGYAGYEALGKSKFTKKKKKEPGTIDCPDGTVLDTKTGVCVAKTQPKPADDWGTGMLASTQALNEGVPVKIFKDADGLWNFGYSWKPRKVGSGSGPLWKWLRAGEPDYDTLVVIYGSETPAEAYTAVGRWMANLKSRMEMFAQNTNMEPGKFIREQGFSILPSYINGPDSWGLIGPVTQRREGSPPTTQFLQDPLEFWHLNVTGPLTSNSGCCDNAAEAGDKLNY